MSACVIAIRPNIYIAFALCGRVSRGTEMWQASAQVLFLCWINWSLVLGEINFDYSRCKQYYSRRFPLPIPARATRTWMYIAAVMNNHWIQNEWECRERERQGKSFSRIRVFENLIQFSMTLLYWCSKQCVFPHDSIQARVSSLFVWWTMWPVDQAVSMRVVWRSTAMASGAQSAVLAGTGRTPTSPVSWLDTKQLFDPSMMASMDQVCPG